MKGELVGLIDEFDVWRREESDRLYTLWETSGEGEDARPEIAHLEFTFENFFEWLKN